MRGKENKRVTKINTVRAHDGPIFKYLFIDWRDIMIVEYALSELSGRPTRREEITLSPWFAETRQG